MAEKKERIKEFAHGLSILGECTLSVVVRRYCKEAEIKYSSRQFLTCVKCIVYLVQGLGSLRTMC
jgi:hypothetical protein